jgi:hypothetical protein
MNLFPLLAFVGLVFLLSRFGHIPFRYAPAATVALICVSGSFGSALGEAWVQTMLLIVMGGIGVGWAVFENLRASAWHKAAEAIGAAGPGHKIPTAEAAFLLALLLLLALKLQGHTFVTWDDFSHWGVFSRDFVKGQGDWNVAYQHTVYRNYPPGLSPLQYFFNASPTSISSFDFVESHSLLANSIAATAFLFPLLGIAFERSYRLAALVGLLSLLMIFGPGNGFRTLMVDHQMAVAFGLCIVALCDPKMSSSTVRYSLVGLVLAHIFLLKPSGAFLAVLCLLFGAYQIVTAEGAIKLGQRFRWAAALGLPLLGSCLLWIKFKAMLGDGAFGASTYSSADAVLKFVSNEEPMRSIRANFLEKLLPISAEERGVSFNKTAASIFILALWFFIFIKHVSIKRSQRIALVVLSAGLLVHATGLLWLYINSFSTGEALVTHSFDRYMGQFIIAPHMLAMAMFVTIPPGGLKKSFQWLLGVLLTISVITFSDGKGLGFALEKNKVLTDRVENVSLKGHIKNDQASNVMAFWDCPSGMEYLVLRYDIHPISVKPVNFPGMSCSKSGAQEIKQSLPHAQQVVASEIKAGAVRDKENYLFVGRGSKEVEDSLRALSGSTKVYRLYRVEFNKAGGVELFGLELK